MLLYTLWSPHLANAFETSASAMYIQLLCKEIEWYLLFWHVISYTKYDTGFCILQCTYRSDWIFDINRRMVDKEHFFHIFIDITNDYIINLKRFRKTTSIIGVWKFLEYTESSDNGYLHIRILFRQIFVIGLTTLNLIFEWIAEVLECYLIHQYKSAGSVGLLSPKHFGR